MIFLICAGYAESLVNFRGPLIAALQAKGIEVHVAAPDLQFGNAFRYALEERGLIVHNVSIVRTGMNPFADLRTLFALWILMRKIRPDYFLGYTIKPVIYGSLAGWLAAVPKRFALITGLGYSFQGEGGRSGLQAIVQKLYALSLSRLNKVFFQNPDDQALFLKLGLLSSKVPSFVVNGSGVDVTSFSVTEMQPGPVRFLLIARLLGDKGVREYVEAARKIRLQYPLARFMLVGWIDENPNSILQAELDDWVSDKSIEFLGRLSDVRPAITACNVYVLPSYREGTPRTVLEAMAMGRPVITTDAPGCRETVVDGDNGFLVPVRSVDALILAMHRFIEDPLLVKKMGQRARLIAEEKYDVHKVNAEMLREMAIT